MKKTRKEKKIKLSKKHGIIRQISVAFIIPILCVILVGVLAYSQAEKGIREKYEDSSLAAIKMIDQYIDLGLQLGEAEALKYANDPNMNKYYLGLYEGDNSKKIQTIDSMKSGMESARTTNKFIHDIHIITQPGVIMQTTKDMKKGSGTGFYDELETEIQETCGSGIFSAWLDSHAIIDERLGTSTEDYLLSYYCASNNSKAGVVVDISKNMILDILDKTDIGAGSTVGLITSGGREVVTGSELDFTLTDGDFYKQFQNSGETQTTGYIKEGGMSYLLLASRNNIADIVVYALIPKDIVTEKANNIKTITILLVILSCVIASVLAALISIKISRRMKLIMAGLDKSSSGDLTAEIKIRGNDEFSSIGQSVTQMLEHMRVLVHDFKESVSRVSETSGEVKNTSDTVNSHSGDINHAIEEIRQGIENQRENANECQQKMDLLSGEIKTVLQEVGKIETFASSSHEMIKSGVLQMNSLSHSSDSTSQVTAKVIDNISYLSQKAKSIEAFIGIINDISEQTTLLSLNASIEAARAGAAGRSFSVVAEEIRKLADNSLEAAEQIQNTVNDIMAQMQETTSNAQEAKEIVGEQEKGVKEMAVIFDKLSLGMTELIMSVDEISQNVESVNAGRHATKLAVGRITEVTESTSDSAAKVGILADELLINAEKMDSISQNLMEDMDTLEKKMEHFVVE
ncbi:methyl-accepting chemotaxis protein [Kineothrix alysoides]|uniref:Methyl-accepting chemotaxis protein n=1 Tax=Kineothrix alysoides TaxID=1469948 RepID=A0A4V2QBP6_9FIRM|nr:methyl-accepting chemotaxis protein [Kineothrix alysoides]TCL57192.1 methyl-accepting chemotaxis protein [Kineothrix alysoides]